MPVRALPVVHVHPTDDLLEEYLFGRVLEPACSRLEEHVLYCHQCQDTLEKASEFAACLKLSLDEYEMRRLRSAHWLRGWPGRWFPGWRGAMPRGLAERWRQSMAAAGVAALAAFFAIVTWHPQPKTGAPAAVALVALRGGEADGLAQAPAGRPLDVTIDATRLPDPDPDSDEGYFLQIVDARGTEVWHGAAATHGAGQLAVQVPTGFGPGMYWVRLHRPAARQTPPELLREFGLRIE